MANAFGLEIRIANLDTTETSTGINYHEISAMEPILVPCMIILD